MLCLIMLCVIMLLLMHIMLFLLMLFETMLFLMHTIPAARPPPTLLLVLQVLVRMVGLLLLGCQPPPAEGEGAAGKQYKVHGGNLGHTHLHSDVEGTRCRAHPPTGQLHRGGCGVCVVLLARPWYQQPNQQGNRQQKDNQPSDGQPARAVLFKGGGQAGVPAQKGFAGAHMGGQEDQVDRQGACRGALHAPAPRYRCFALRPLHLDVKLPRLARQRLGAWRCGATAAACQRLGACRCGAAAGACGRWLATSMCCCYSWFCLVCCCCCLQVGMGG
mmetsp:Transcript_16061/g.34732  ORF Transcript_16061/g.34732 Transcript_16061/m.34732 type:complete len:274 (+) Transcript_16061:421-1242(+)